MDFHSRATSVHHVPMVVQGEKNLTIQRRKYKVVKTVNLIPHLIGREQGFFLEETQRGKKNSSAYFFHPERD